MKIITKAVLDALFVGYRAEFKKGLGTADSQYERIATKVPSATGANLYSWLGQFPKLREWIGDRQVKQMAADGYSITNKTFESTVGVERTQIEDDQEGIFLPLFDEMGRATKTHPDELVFPLLATGTGTLCYDGQNYFDTDHPVYPNVDGTGVPTTVSNFDDAGVGAGPKWYLLCTSRALKPLIFQERTQPELTALTGTSDEVVFRSDAFQFGVRYRCNAGYGFWQFAYCSNQPLNEANFRKAFGDMEKFVADGGRKLGIVPDLLVVPTDLRAAAETLIEASHKDGGATNINYKKVGLMVSPWL